MIAGVFIVVLAGLLAYFYPTYAAWLHIPYPMSDAEARILSLYLVVIGIIYLLLTRPRKRPVAPPKPVAPPAASPVPQADPAKSSDRTTDD